MSNNICHDNTPITPKKERCEACRKKVGLQGHRCKCGKQFCISHLQAEQHQCSFDHKAEGRLNMEREYMIGPLRDKMTERV